MQRIVDGGSEALQETSSYQTRLRNYPAEHGVRSEDEHYPAHTFAGSLSRFSQKQGRNSALHRTALTCTSGCKS